MSGPGPAGPVPEPGPELVAGALRGYRTWHLVPRGSPVESRTLPLASVTRPQVVWGRELAAQCAVFERTTVAHPHAAPDRDCTCGVYAWYAPADADEYAAEVFGVVDAHGRVLMGTRGFRAEQVTIRAVATRDRRCAAACEAAGIAVYRRRRDLLADHPPDDVTALVGPPVPGPPRWRPRGFGLAVALSVVLRAALLVAVAGLLPAGLALATLVAVEVLIFAVVVRCLRT